MKPRGDDPMRPSTPSPASSWWTERDVQQDRGKFAQKLAEQGPRQTAVTVAYNKTQGER